MTGLVDRELRATVDPRLTALRRVAIVPAYNEEGKIGRVVRKIPPGVVDAVVVVDDCSRDRTSEEARECGAIVLRHEINQGVGAEMVAERWGLSRTRLDEYSLGELWEKNVFGGRPTR